MPHTTAEPYFRVCLERGVPSVAGIHQQRLGHRGANDTGVWCHWTWDQDRGRFQLRNDRYGFFPVYYRQDTDRLVVSTSILELLRRDGRTVRDTGWNDAAMAVFLRLEQFLGCDTPFAGIHALPPGARLEWQNGKTTLEAGPCPLPVSPISLDRAAAITRYGEVFQAAVDSMLPAPQETSLVPLSGGRDSRHILFALAETGHRPTSCVTLRHLLPKADEDAEVAATVAAMVGVDHLVLDQPGQLFQTELWKNQRISFCSDKHAWIVPLGSHVVEQGFDVLYDGIAGDVLSAGLLQDEQRHSLCTPAGVEQLAELLLGPEGYLPRMLPPRLYRRWHRDLARQHVVAELRRYLDCANPMGQFLFWNRTRRDVALCPWNLLVPPSSSAEQQPQADERRTRVLTPFLEPSVHDFLTALPGRYFLDHAFHSLAIAQRYPRWAHLRYENKQAPRRRVRRRDIADYVFALARYSLSLENGEVRMGFLLPRLLKALLLPSFAASIHEITKKPLWLMQMARS